jgi:TonB family protein
LPVSEHKNWKLSLLRWWNGASTRNDESHLDILASKDAFLSEALEGYREFPEAEHLADISNIKARLNEKYGKKERRILPIWRIAAAAAMFVGVIGGFWFVNQSLNQREAIAQEEAFEKSTPTEVPTKEIAQNKLEKQLETPKELPNSSPLISPPASTSNYKLLEKNVNTFINESKADIKEGTDTQIVEPSRGSYVEEIATAQILVEEESQEVLADDAEIIPQAEEANQPSILKSAPIKSRAVPNKFEDVAPIDERLSMERSTVPPSLRAIEGTVTDELGEPLIGVNILVPGTQNGVVTDFDGNFQLNVTEEDSALEVSYTGYESQIVPLDAQPSYPIILNSSNAELSEITVVGLGVKKRKKDTSYSAKSKSSNRPMPKGGFDKFQRYIEKNQQYPALASIDSIEGTVILLFQVNKNGTLSNIRIEQSLSPDCDQEAIRLLKKGPKWKTKEPQEMTWVFAFPSKK